MLIWEMLLYQQELEIAVNFLILGNNIHLLICFSNIPYYMVGSVLDTDIQCIKVPCSHEVYILAEETENKIL